MGLLKISTGIVMQHCERLPWRGVRHMVFRTRNKATCILPRVDGAFVFGSHRVYSAWRPVSRRIRSPLDLAHGDLA